MRGTPLLYLVGPPGSGKSTLMAATIRALGLTALPRSAPIAHTEYFSGAVGIDPCGLQLGATRSAFSGTDALPMNVQPKAMAFLEVLGAPAVVAEGDRLANDGFFGHARACGYDLDVVVLDVGWDVAQARRDARGSAQNEGWLRGRHTKVARLADHWSAFRIDGEAGTLESEVAALRSRRAFVVMEGS